MRIANIIYLVFIGQILYKYFFQNSAFIPAIKSLITINADLTSRKKHFKWVITSINFLRKNQNPQTPYINFANQVR